MRKILNWRVVMEYRKPGSQIENVMRKVLNIPTPLIVFTYSSDVLPDEKADGSIIYGLDNVLKIY